MTVRTRIGLAALAGACCSNSAMAQAPLTPAGYQQNFNAMATGTTAPIGWSVWTVPSSNTTFTSSIPASGIINGTQTSPAGALGVFTQSGTGAPGANNNGYNFAFAANAADRILGASPTGQGASVLQLTLVNNTGGAVSQITVSYNTRVVSAANSDELRGYRFFYSTSGTAGPFSGVAALDAVVASGDAAGATLARNATITLASTVLPGANIVLRWVDDNASQNSPDQAYGIDAVAVVGTGVPVGACCAAGGECTFSLDAASCAGAFQGINTVCAPNPCPQPPVACCSADGSCTLIAPGLCTGFPVPGVCTPILCRKPGDTRLCAFGDHGVDNANQASVADRMKTFNPEFLVTVGDNSYSTSTNISNFDNTQGRYYREFIKIVNPASVHFGLGAAVNNFFPCMGNHDFDIGGGAGTSIPYWNAYWELPGNERSYTVIRGPVEFFILSSDGREPDSNAVGGTQHTWFVNAYNASTAKYKIPVFHHPPHTNPTNHGPDAAMLAWNFQNLPGITAVLTGHNHNMQRLEVNGVPFFVSGAGGNTLYSVTCADPNNAFFNDTQFGFLLIDANNASISFRFISAGGTILDTRIINRPGACCTGAACVGGVIQPNCAGAFTPDAVCTPPNFCCPADINNSGILSVQDLFDFLALYFAHDPRGDFNNSTVISVQDLFDFLAAYFAGCN